MQKTRVQKSHATVSLNILEYSVVYTGETFFPPTGSAVCICLNSLVFHFAGSSIYSSFIYDISTQVLDFCDPKYRIVQKNSIKMHADKVWPKFSCNLIVGAEGCLSPEIQDWNKLQNCETVFCTWNPGLKRYWHHFFVFSNPK